MSKKINIKTTYNKPSKETLKNFAEKVMITYNDIIKNEQAKEKKVS